MIKIFKISSLVFVLLLLYAPSCIDEQEAERRNDILLKDERDEIRNEFETDYLDEASLFAYESMARQKLYDLSDYFRILSDTSLEMEFRVRAGEMIRRSFLSDLVLVGLNPGRQEQVEFFKVGVLIGKSLENELPLPLFSIDSVVIQEPFRRTGSSSYSGKLKFVQLVIHPSRTGQPIHSIPRSANGYVVKEKKMFGNDTLNIWTVRLGEIQ
jgi:hypothetical protein